MSESTSKSAGTAPDSPETPVASQGEGLPVTQADILMAASASDEMMAALPETAATPALAASVDALNLSDVLPSTDPNLGAYFKVETVDGNTVISVDPDGVGSTPAMTVVTLEGVTGLTLQQLLQNDPGIT